MDRHSPQLSACFCNYTLIAKIVLNTSKLTFADGELDLWYQGCQFGGAGRVKKFSRSIQEAHASALNHALLDCSKIEHVGFGVALSSLISHPPMFKSGSESFPMARLNLYVSLFFSFLSCHSESFLSRTAKGQYYCDRRMMLCSHACLAADMAASVCQL